MVSSERVSQPSHPDRPGPLRLLERRSEPPDSGLLRAGRRCPVCGESFPEDYAVCPRDASPLGGRGEHGDPLLGVMLGGTYRVTRLLARGGMGRLYEAEHTRLPRRVAVKVIHEAFANNEAVVARFEREARAAASVHSDHVVAVVDVLRAPDGRPCLVTEYLEGEDLQTRLERTATLPLAEALSVARQLCRGLAAAHSQGVVHRDLKPSNVFLATCGGGRVTAKLLDFGVAKLLGAPDITRDGAVVGTPAYMAPEQARGASTVDGRADVYGVGAVLYRALTGTSPHEGPDATASLARLLDGPPRPVRELAPQVPEEVVTVLDRALAREPEHRHPNVRALSTALASLDPGDDIAHGSSTGAHAGALGTAGEGESTLVLPRGAVSGATALGRRQRRARPLSAALVGVAAVSGGLGAATCFAGGARIAAHAHRLSGATAALAAVLAVVGAVGVAVLLGRALRARWRDAGRVDRFAQRLGRGLALGAGTLGAISIGQIGWSAITDGGAAASPAATTAALIAATAVCVLVTALGLSRDAETPA